MAQQSSTIFAFFQTRIIARRQQIDAGKGDYAASISPDILDFYTRFFDVAYPLPKAGNNAWERSTTFRHERLGAGRLGAAD